LDDPGVIVVVLEGLQFAGDISR